MIFLMAHPIADLVVAFLALLLILAITGSVGED